MMLIRSTTHFRDIYENIMLTCMVYTYAVTYYDVVCFVLNTT